MTPMNPPNNIPDDFNVAALAAARKINPKIPEGALPVIFMNAIEIYPDITEMAETVGDYGGMTAREMADEMENSVSLMVMPKGYQCLGFATHNGTEWDQRCVFRRSRPPIPIDVGPRYRAKPASESDASRPPRRGCAGGGMDYDGLTAVSVKRTARCLRMDSPRSVMRWLLWTRRSRIASASVGSAR